MDWNGPLSEVIVLLVVSAWDCRLAEGERRKV